MRIKAKIHVGKTRPMKSLEGNISSCRHCSFYRSEGRRGGSCQQLGVPVQGNWSICPLAVPPFQPSWKNLPGMVSWQAFDLDAEVSSPIPLETELTTASETLNLENITCPET
jgi:hypothetical protein